MNHEVGDLAVATDEPKVRRCKNCGDPADFGNACWDCCSYGGVYGYE